MTSLALEGFHTQVLIFSLPFVTGSHYACDLHLLNFFQLLYNLNSMETGVLSFLFPTELLIIQLNIQHIVDSHKYLLNRLFKESYSSFLSPNLITCKRTYAC